MSIASMQRIGRSSPSVRSSMSANTGRAPTRSAALALETARAALEQAVVERDGRRAARDAASRLQPLARLLAEAAPEDASIGEMAALADLAVGDAAAAEVGDLGRDVVGAGEHRRRRYGQEPRRR